MIDYRGIEALHTVLEAQSFELAAKKLHLTQSAVSQRIKGLEKFYGKPVLVRTLPYSPTQLGEHLIVHFKQITLLEEALEKQMEGKTERTRISIALNRDSLETWFLDLLRETDLLDDYLLDINADDQELTLDYLKKGLVSACLSTSQKAIIGGKVSFLGDMEYMLVASPEFKREYFSGGNLKRCLLRAPGIKFDQNDHLHERYLEKFLGINGKELDYQIIPSVKGFKMSALLGLGYALIPKIDIVQELKKKELVPIHHSWKIPTYWHYWALESESYKKFNRNIIHHAEKKLRG